MTSETYTGFKENNILNLNAEIALTFEIRKKEIVENSKMAINNIIGRNIRTLRENAGYTQSNIAAFMGVDQSLVSKIEKGERALSADMIEKLAALYGVSVDQLENEHVELSKLSYAFRGGELSNEEMEAISAINRIALNAEFMRVILERE